MLVVNAVTHAKSITIFHLDLVLALQVPLFVVFTMIDLLSSPTLENMISSVGKLLESVESYRTTHWCLLAWIKNVPNLCLSNASGKGLDLLKKIFNFVSPPTAGSSPIVEENSSGKENKISE